VFFSNCGLRCVYCQNYQISLDGYGTEISTQRLARAFLELAGQGAHNINLVTATQYSLEVMEAVQVARSMGLKIPVIWNSSGYENVETIMRLADTVDAWLMDFRYCSAALAERYSQASDYPSVAAAALLAAVQQSGPYTLDSSGLMTSGVLVRFLLLPGLLSDTIACVDQVFSLVGNSVCYSLLSQYTPPAGITERYPELAGQVSAWDYDLLIDHVLGLGITDSFMQEEGSSSADFIPAFDLAGVVNQSVQ
jgi:putative pyruvate formate lyase activating enzyme